MVLSKVRNNNKIEEIITEQTKDLNLNPDEICDILEKDEYRILIVLDGLDEFDMNINTDIRNIITNNLLSHVDVLVTSRPEVITKEFQHNFHLVAEMQGYTRQSRSEVCRKFLKTKDKVTDFLR